MITPLDDLVQCFGPNGTGGRKPCTGHPIFAALWKTCSGCGSGGCTKGGHCGTITCRCDGTGYIQRSRAEIALRLPEACPQINLRHAKLPDGIRSHQTGLNQWWVATLPCPIAEHNHSWEQVLFPHERTCLQAEAANWLDALAAAMLAAVKAMEGTGNET